MSKCVIYRLPIINSIMTALTALDFTHNTKQSYNRIHIVKALNGISLTNEIIFITPTINYIIVYQYILDMTNDCNLIISNDP